MFFCSGESRPKPEGMEQKSREVALLERTAYFLKATAGLLSDPHTTEVPEKPAKGFVRRTHARDLSSTPPLPLCCLLLVPGLGARTCIQGRVHTNPYTPARAPAPSRWGCAVFLSQVAGPSRLTSPCHPRTPVFQDLPARRRSVTHTSHLVLCFGAQVLRYTFPQKSLCPTPERKACLPFSGLLSSLHWVCPLSS